MSTVTLPRYYKHPLASRYYPISVKNLGTNTIGVPSATVTPSGATVDNIAVDGNRVYVLVSGGDDAVTYQIEVSIPISNGEVLVVEFEVIGRDA